MTTMALHPQSDLRSLCAVQMYRSHDGDVRVKTPFSPTNGQFFSSITAGRHALVWDSFEGCWVGNLTDGLFLVLARALRSRWTTAVSVTMDVVYAEGPAPKGLSQHYTDTATWMLPSGTVIERRNWVVL